MKKTYFKPQVQSEDTFEQTANRTGVNFQINGPCDPGFEEEIQCRINNLIDEGPGGEVGSLCEIVVSEKS